ncbi:Aconitate hydratase_ mitochondrial [Caligus rogercresseyi]|uniref:Aconitate hydratase_ mitochondrial n=1 Tax=Caligus rogercresseyi TaxID=217165 RepID=A0A7T8KAU5_CALRO|nr:Aconitate hydratase_ mitochondrial [Caligus rogercresseyi]
MTAVLSLAGTLDFDPRNDSLKAADGSEFKLDPPYGDELPSQGFDAGEDTYQHPPSDGGHVTVDVDPKSNRLQLLTPFDNGTAGPQGHARAHQGQGEMHHGSHLRSRPMAQVPWASREHLQQHAHRAVNSENEEVNSVKNYVTGEYKGVPDVAAEYKKSGLKGSSREHAALEPRFLGGRAIIVKSFARIHETNLKKQGMLPLTFSDKADYDKIRPDDKITLNGLANFAPGRPIVATLSHVDGSSEDITLNHSFNEQQIDWFKAGSALNRMKEMTGAN